MKIKIFKNTNNKPSFKLEDEELEFNYDNINKFIDNIVEKNLENIEFDCQDELLQDYETLLKNIKVEVGTEDFQKAYKLTKNNK